MFYEQAWREHADHEFNSQHDYDREKYAGELDGLDDYGIPEHNYWGTCVEAPRVVYICLNYITSQPVPF